MRRSLANYRRSDVRSKPHVKGRVQKRQRTLGEFKIPTTDNLPIRKRDGMKLIVNNDESPIVLDEDGTTLYPEDIMEEAMIINSEKEIKYKEEIHFKIKTNEVIHSDSIESLREENSQDNIIEIIEPEDEISYNDDIVEEIQDDVMEISETATQENTSIKDSSMECPICHVDISDLELYAREAHCEQCLDKSLNPKSTVKKAKSPKKNTQKEKKEKKLKKPKKPRPPLPSIKILTFHSNYKLVVDGFNFDSHPDIDKYFLSHFHSDHYMGVGKNWNQGIIYCSKITSKLLQFKFNFPSEKIFELENEEWNQITNSIDVMTIDANHCPGASIFLFRERNGDGQVVKQILHTGDFRVTEALTLKIASVLDGFDIDQIYLDTTYLNLGNSHPTQDEVVQKTAKYMKSYFNDINKQNTQKKSNNILDKLVRKQEHKKRKNIILVGSYSIGKEKLAQGIANELNNGNKAVYINDDSLRQHFIPGNERLSLTETNYNSSSVDVHIVSLGLIKDDNKICEYIRQQYHGLTWLDINLVGIIPTGWTFHGAWGYQKQTYEDKMKAVQNIIESNEHGSHIDNSWFDKQMLRRDKKKLKERGKFYTFNVPYSEHSSFPELIQFMCSPMISWNEIIPTVNMDKLEDMLEWFNIIKSLYK